LIELIGYQFSTHCNFLLQELCDFDLGNALDDSRKPDPTLKLHALDFLPVLDGIIDGMIHLSKMNTIHRDLALRNIFLKNMVPKIGDFGLAVTADSTGIFIADANEGMWKEQPPEAVEKFEYSEKSDVWSFGIIAWSVFGRNFPPYAILEKEEFLSYWRNAPSIEKPPSCPQWM